MAGRFFSSPPFPTRIAALAAALLLAAVLLAAPPAAAQDDADYPRVGIEVTISDFGTAFASTQGSGFVPLPNLCARRLLRRADRGRLVLL